MLHKLLLLSGLIVLLSISACKKNDPIDDNSDAAKLATVVNTQNELGAYLSDIIPFQGDTFQVLRDLGSWLDDREDVRASYFIDEGMIRIDFDNDLSTYVRFISVDGNGIHQVRGGGGNGTLARYKFGETSAANTIKNEKVLILNPVLDEFYGGYYNKEKQFEGGPVSFEVHIYNDGQVTLDNLNQLGDYGFIILNTHGKTNGFLLKELPEFKVATKNWTGRNVTELMVNKHNLPLSKFISGELEMNMHVYYDKSNGVTTYDPNVYVTEKYIRNLNVDLSDAVLFGNTCYSGHTADGPNENNMPEAWRSRGLSTYYGYSYANDIGIKVDNDFCKEMEDSLIQNLAIETDSTGMAHLENNEFLQYDDNTYTITPRAKVLAVLSEVKKEDVHVIINQPLFFKLFFADDYAYDNCQDTLVDPRDSLVYKTVCIGNQVWMAENLNWAGAGVCYDNDPDNCKTFGRLYSIDEATGRQSGSISNHVQGICPTNWHVPTKEEYEELFTTVGGTSIAGKKLRADTIWGGIYEDQFGFSGLPAGRGINNNGAFSFAGLGTRLELWTASIYSGTFGDDFYVADIKDPSASFWGMGDDKDYRLPCRCIKD